MRLGHVHLKQSEVNDFRWESPLSVLLSQALYFHVYITDVVFYLIIHWYNNSFGNLTCCHKKLGIWFSSWSRHTTQKWVWIGYMVGIPRNLVSSTQTQCPQSSHAMSCSLDCSGLRIFFPISNHFAVGYWILSQTSQWNLLNLPTVILPLLSII